MKKQNRKAGRVLPAVLAVSVAAAQYPVSAQETVKGTEKEEVVYVNLNPDGSVEEINVVNSFQADGTGEIIDYGEYQSLRNMTTTDAIAYSGDTVTIQTDAAKLYYEGKLSSREMPWKIEIRYELDGKEYTAEELAGKSGKLNILISIQKNENVKKSFFEDYALQASLTLDTEKCSDIRADGATIANVGSNKQLNYTILPGTETDLTVSADVTEFEMDGIAVNAIPLNLDVDVDDEELMDQITELLDAIEQLDDGAKEVESGVSELQEGAQDGLQSGSSDLNAGAAQLYSGAEELKDGGQTLKGGAKSLKSGAVQLDDGIKALNTGITQMQTGLEALDKQSGSLTDGSLQIRTALTQLQQALSGVSDFAAEIQTLVTSSDAILQAAGQLSEGAASLKGGTGAEAWKTVLLQNDLDVESLKTGNAEAIETLNGLLGQADSYAALLEKMGVKPEVIEPIKNQGVSVVNQMITLLNGNNAALQGTESYLSGIGQGASDLADGAAALQSNYQQFDAAIESMTGTLSDMMSQMTQLKDAMDALVTEYAKLDGGLGAYTDGVGQLTSGYEKISEGAESLQTGSSELRKGSGSLYGGMEDLLDGIVEFYQATGTLMDGTGQLDTGVADLLEGISTLYDGTGELSEGTGEMREETAGMDTEIKEKIDELLDSISGADKDIVSFTSEKNKEITAVQFVIKTEAIKIPEEPETEETEAETESFAQKLTDLF